LVVFWLVFWWLFTDQGKVERTDKIDSFLSTLGSNSNDAAQ